jgi:serine/threonine-protein kinase
VRGVSLPLSDLDGRLDLKGLLGTGGMGEVHRAWDRALERAVAVKSLRGADEREAERLLLEARLQARVEHPNVVRVHEVGRLGGRPCIVLQLVEGRSLADRAAALPQATRVELVRQAALGVHAAHREGLVHRDVKPGNVLVDDAAGAPVARVSDFGLARGEEGGLTRSGLPPGTLAFMAPEQLLGAPVDLRSDVYSLGATLYAVLAGAPPFGTSGASHPEPVAAIDPSSLLRRILEEPPPRLPGEVPEELRRVVSKAMEKEPAQRYASAEAFADDLGRYQRGEPVRARPAPPTERALRWARRNRLAARALAAAAVAVLVGGGLSVWTKQGAGLEALEAARLGAEAQALQQAMTMAQLLPLHDLGPVLQEVRRALATVDERRGGRAEGPAAYLKGLAHQLLGAQDAALPWLRRAWELGDRRPELAYALATAEGERYAHERSQLAGIEDPELRDQLLDQAERQWRDPALARLAALSELGGALGRLAAARSALLAGRLEEAAEALRPVTPGEPAWLAAQELALGARLLRVRELIDHGELARARAEAVATVAQGEAALQVARSGFTLRLLVARLHTLWGRVLESPPVEALAHHAEGLRLLAEARALDPGSGAALEASAEAFRSYTGNLYDLGRPFEPSLQEGLDLAKQATVLIPGSADAWAALASMEGDAANFLSYADQEVAAHLIASIDAGRRALELDPDDSMSRLQISMTMLLRAARAQEAGRAGDQDLAEAIAEASRVVEIGRVPMRGLAMRAWALRARAQGALWTGRDPGPDFASAWEDLRAAWRLQPGSGLVASRGLDVVYDWATVAVAHGEAAGLPFEEVLGWGRRLATESPGHAILMGQVGRVLGLSAVAERRAGRPFQARLEEAEALILTLKDSGIAQLVRRTLAQLRVELAWVTRAAADAAVAEARSRACTRAEPRDAKAQRLLAAAVLLQGELAASPATRAGLLREAVAAANLAIDGGQRDAVALALRGRAREAQRPGSGAADLAEARRMDPRLLLLELPTR